MSPESAQEIPGLGAVAAGHTETVGAALEMLHAGGNAVDAAIAGTFASFVAEPLLTSPFGGGLMTVALPDGRAHVLDFFARVPGLGHRESDPPRDFRGVLVNFGPATQEFHIGRGAAAVPGTLAGLLDAHRRWGRLPLVQVVAPAVRLAREGVRLDAQMAFTFRLLVPILTASDEARALYAPSGEVLGEGEVFRTPELGALLEALADETTRVDAQRTLDAAIVAAFGTDGGRIGHADLERAGPVLREPYVVPFRDARVFLPPPPLLGGPLVALGLRLLCDTTHPEEPAPSALAVAHALASLSLERRRRAVDFLSEDSTRALADALRALLQGGIATGSTTHVSAIDASGLAVSVTHSNGEGCGVLVPGTGAMMNNFLGEEDINPLGFHRQMPGEEMMTMMCPTVARRGETVWALGSGGSNRIRSALLQTLSNLFWRGLPAVDATRAPRLHVEGADLSMELAGRDPGEAEALRRAFPGAVEFAAQNMFFGGVHLVSRGPAGFAGAGDPRRGGVFAVATPEGGDPCPS